MFTRLSKIFYLKNFRDINKKNFLLKYNVITQTKFSATLIYLLQKNNFEYNKLFSTLNNLGFCFIYFKNIFSKLFFFFSKTYYLISFIGTFSGIILIYKSIIKLEILLYYFDNNINKFYLSVLEIRNKIYLNKNRISLLNCYQKFLSNTNYNIFYTSSSNFYKFFSFNFIQIFSIKKKTTFLKSI